MDFSCRCGLFVRCDAYAMQWVHRKRHFALNVTLRTNWNKGIFHFLRHVSNNENCATLRGQITALVVSSFPELSVVAFQSHCTGSSTDLPTSTWRFCFFEVTSLRGFFATGFLLCFPLYLHHFLPWIEQTVRTHPSRCLGNLKLEN